MLHWYRWLAIGHSVLCDSEPYLIRCAVGPQKLGLPFFGRIMGVGHLLLYTVWSSRAPSDARRDNLQQSRWSPTHVDLTPSG